MTGSKSGYEQSEQIGEKAPRILRGRIDSFALYEITDAELDLLEAGSPGSLYLIFSIFLMSTAFSFLTSLLTCTMSNRVFTVFVVLTTIGIVVGVLLFLLWFRARQSVSGVVRRIRSRIPG